MCREEEEERSWGFGAGKGLCKMGSTPAFAACGIYAGWTCRTDMRGCLSGVYVWSCRKSVHERRNASDSIEQDAGCVSGGMRGLVEGVMRKMQGVYLLLHPLLIRTDSDCPSPSSCGMSARGPAPPSHHRSQYAGSFHSRSGRGYCSASVGGAAGGQRRRRPSRH